MLGQIVAHTDGYSYVLIDEHSSTAHVSFKRFPTREACICNAMKCWGKCIQFVDCIDPTVT